MPGVGEDREESPVEMRPRGDNVAEGSEPQVESTRGMNQRLSRREGHHPEVQAGHGAVMSRQTLSLSLNLAR